MGPAAFGGRPHYAPLVFKALASASIKSIGHPLGLEALGNYLFQKPPATTCFESFPVREPTSEKMLDNGR